MSWPVRFAALSITAVSALGCRSETAIHQLDPDLNRMQEQPRYDAYEASRFFADGKAMREPPAGTIPYAPPTGRRAPPADDGPEDERPLRVTADLLQTGRRKFDQVCAACHGITGSGDTVVAVHMQRPPPSLHEPRILALRLGRLYQVIEEGYGYMPAYASHLDRRERWAIVAYVKALQRSQGSPVDDLPPALAERVRGGAP